MMGCAFMFDLSVALNKRFAFVYEICAFHVSCVFEYFIESDVKTSFCCGPCLRAHWN